MTNERFRQYIEREGFTKGELMHALGVDRWVLESWLYGISPVPFWVSLGLGYMAMNAILGNPPERGVAELIEKHLNRRHQSIKRERIE